MGYPIQQGTAAQPLLFRLINSTDHVSGLTGKAGSVAVKIGKAGAAGVTPAGAITEVDATNLPGWYAVAGNATDSNTAGPLILYAKDAASDPVDDLFHVVPYNPLDASLGIPMLSAKVADAVQSSPSPTATAFAGSGSLSSSDNFYSAPSVAVLAFYTGANAGRSARITGYTGSTRLLQFAAGFPTAPASTDRFVILGVG